MRETLAREILGIREMRQLRHLFLMHGAGTNTGTGERREHLSMWPNGRHVIDRFLCI